MNRTLAILFAAGLFSLTLSGASLADININIGINPSVTPAPPKVVIASPPAVILLPGTSIYFVPDMAEDVVFVMGHWYLRSDGRWFRANDYNGPWVFISNPPSELVELPAGFRHVPPGHERIPYGQLKKNWRKWDDERRERHEFREHVKEHKGKGRHRD